MRMTQRQRVDIYRDTLREASAPFEYGKNDCMLLLARAVHRLVGIDHAKGFGQYGVRKAARIVREHGDLVVLVSKFLGWPEPGAATLRVADPCIVEIDGVQAGGLYNGHDIVVFGPGGLRQIDTRYLIAGWRVG